MQKVHRLYLYNYIYDCSTYIQFHTLFTTFGSFHLSFTVLLHYRLIKVFNIRRWFSLFQTKFLKFRFTCVLFYKYKNYRIITFLYKGIPPLFNRYYKINIPRIYRQYASLIINKYFIFNYTIFTYYTDYNNNQ